MTASLFIPLFLLYSYHYIFRSKPIDLVLLDWDLGFLAPGPFHNGSRITVDV